MHDVTYVLALGVRSCVLRGNIPSHHLPGCGYVGPTRMSDPLRGVYVTPSPIWNLAHGGPCVYEDLDPPWLLRVS